MIFKKNTSSLLRHRLTLQEEVQTGDDAGGYVRSWEDVTDVWAQIIPAKSSSLRGAENLFAAQLQASTSHLITLRYRNDITASHRLIFESRVFNIRAIADPDGKRERLELLVEEGVAA